MKLGEKLIVDRKMYDAVMGEIEKCPGAEELGALAHKLGVNVSTLYNYKSGRAFSSWFVDRQRIQEAMKNGHAPGTPVEKMNKHAIQGNDELNQLIQRLFKQGKSYKEIARATGVPVGSIWPHLHPDYYTRRKQRQKAARHAATAKKASPPKRKPGRVESFAKDLMELFQGAADKERAALTARHDREMKALEVHLAARQSNIIDDIIDKITKPVPPPPEGAETNE